jgi:DNA-binding protein
MSYVLAVVTQFSNGLEQIHLKARGKAISKAVDVAEIVRNKFIQDARVRDIKIGTEELEGENKEKINVSTMEIILGK